MAGDNPKVKLGIETRLKKYSEGKNPETDEPDEVVRHNFEVSGERAEKIIKAERE